MYCLYILLFDKTGTIQHSTRKRMNISGQKGLHRTLPGAATDSHLHFIKYSNRYVAVQYVQDEVLQCIGLKKFIASPPPQCYVESHMSRSSGKSMDQGAEKLCVLRCSE